MTPDEGHENQWTSTALRAVQLNDRAADDAEASLAGQRPDQVVYFAPTARVPAARFLELAGDRPVVLQAERSALPAAEKRG